MNVPVRLGLYAAGLVLLFTASATVADAVIPQETVDSWIQQVDDAGQDSIGQDGVDQRDTGQDDTGQDDIDH